MGEGLWRGFGAARAPSAPMRRGGLFLAATFLAVLLVGALRAAQARDCPASAGKGPFYYLDADHGDDKGDGSQAHPWRTLPRALAAPGLAAGGVLRLRDGDYGRISIVNRLNRGFVVVEAAPGQHPRLRGLYLANARKWVFRGLTFNEDLAALPPAARGFLVTLWGPHQDIVLADNRLGGTPMADWSQADWLAHVPSGVLDAGRNTSSCTLIRNNRFEDISFGIVSQRSPRTIIERNVINRFDHDGIDFGSSDMVIRANLLTNRIDAGDGHQLHPDFLQGQPWGSMEKRVDHLRNIIIDGNVMIMRTQPDLPFAALSRPDFDVHGVGVFDGDWTHLRVTNNVIVTRSYHGISLWGVHHGAILNNTVLSDGNDALYVPWVGAFVAKSLYGGRPSSDVVIANNIAGAVYSDPDNRHVRVAHNLLLAAEGKGVTVTWAKGDRVAFEHLSGRWGDHNAISARPVSDVFVAYDPAALVFDLHLRPGSPAVGSGLARLAPRRDGDGRLRHGRGDLGAYVFTGR